MAFPKLTRSNAYDTVISILKNDPILKREVKTFRYWSGDPKDLEEFSVGEAPWMKVTPHPDKMEFFDNKSYKAHFLLDVELGVAGTDAGEIMDFWESVERAFTPTNQTSYGTVVSRMQGAGIVAVEFKEAGWDVQNKGGLPLTGKGMLDVWFYVKNHGGNQ